MHNECEEEDKTITKKRKRNYSSRKISKKKGSLNQLANTDHYSSVNISEDAGYAADIDFPSASDAGTNECYTENTSEEENWEVSDFSSSGYSSDEWTPDK